MGVCLSREDARQRALSLTGVAGVNELVAETKSALQNDGHEFVGEGEKGTFEDTASKGDNIITGGRKKKRRKTRRRNKKKKTRKKKRRKKTRKRT